MPQTYKATGINLKGVPLGESDRLLTILTRERGLIRAVAPGTRKPRSKLGGRGELFVVNELLLSKGRSLDRIIQADTLESYGGLSQDLGKLAAGQYLAELVISQALSGQTQEELFLLLSEHLSRLEQLPSPVGKEAAWQLIAYLTHGTFHLLALAGIAPQVQFCCLTQRRLIPNYSDPEWRAGFSIDAGGTFSLPLRDISPPSPGKPPNRSPTDDHPHAPMPMQKTPINAAELTLLQQLAQPRLTDGPKPLKGSGGFWEGAGQNPSPEFRLNAASDPPFDPSTLKIDPSYWVSVERILRRYAQYHLGCSIRSAVLIDTYTQMTFS